MPKNPESSREPQEFLVVVNPHDDFRFLYIWVKDSKGREFTIPIYEGVEYRQVYGVSRILRDPNNPKEPLFEAYEIQGRIDTENGRWSSAKMKIKDLKTLEEEIMDVENWTFSVYEGDKIYLGEKKIFSSKIPS